MSSPSLKMSRDGDDLPLDGVEEEIKLLSSTSSAAFSLIYMNIKKFQSGNKLFMTNNTIYTSVFET